MAADVIVFGEATTRRLRVDHRPEVVPPPWLPAAGGRRCSTCNIAVRFVFRVTLGWGYWQHVPAGRVVVP